MGEGPRQHPSPFGASSTQVLAGSDRLLHPGFQESCQLMRMQDANPGHTSLVRHGRALYTWFPFDMAPLAPAHDKRYTLAGYSTDQFTVRQCICQPS